MELIVVNDENKPFGEFFFDWKQFHGVLDCFEHSDLNRFYLSALMNKEVNKAARWLSGTDNNGDTSGKSVAATWVRHAMEI